MRWLYLCMHVCMYVYIYVGMYMTFPNHLLRLIPIIQPIYLPIDLSNLTVPTIRKTLLLLHRCYQMRTTPQHVSPTCSNYVVFYYLADRPSIGRSIFILSLPRVCLNRRKSKHQFIPPRRRDERIDLFDPIIVDDFRGEIWIDGWGDEFHSCNFE